MQGELPAGARIRRIASTFNAKHVKHAVNMPIPKVETMSPDLQRVLWKVFCDIATVSWSNLNTERLKELGELDKALAELRSRFKTEFGNER